MKIQSAMAVNHQQTGVAAEAVQLQANKEKNTSPDTFAYRDPALTKAEIEDTLLQLNQTVEALNIGFRFKLHEETDRYIFQVVNLQSNEVLKEIPSQKMLDLAAQIDHLVGLLLDDKR